MIEAKLNLIKAEMQFVGWRSHETGETIIDMITAMNLSAIEWIELNSNYIVSLSDDDKEEITNYFIKELKKEKYLQERENRNIGMDIIKLKKINRGTK